LIQTSTYFLPNDKIINIKIKLNSAVKKLHNKLKHDIEENEAVS